MSHSQPGHRCRSGQVAMMVGTGRWVDNVSAQRRRSMGALPFQS